MAKTGQTTTSLVGADNLAARRMNLEKVNDRD